MYRVEALPPIPWAKLQRPIIANSIDALPSAWLSLVDHSADVAAVFEAMLDVPVVRMRLANLAGLVALDEQMRQRLCVYVALHDFGKANIGFQSRWHADAPIVGHCPEALIGLIDRSACARLMTVMPLAEMMAWGAHEDAFHAILGHHGRPLDPSLSEGNRAVYWSPVAGYDPVLALKPLCEAVREWFPAAFGRGGPALPTRAPFWHAVAGLVTLADWIASDETNFPLLAVFKGGDPHKRMAESRAQVGVLLRQIGFDPAQTRAACVASRGFEAVSAHPPRPVQEATAAWTNADRILVLESETGSGKTEAALARFARLFAAGEVDGLYFALPTRVAATSLHARVARAVERLFPDPALRPTVILAVPGVSGPENVGAAAIAAPAVGLDVWEAQAAQDFNRAGWAADRPKKYLAGTIAVGTIDQALLGIVAVKHAHLRLSSLMRHLLVVDEVHASDRYMSSLLNALLKFHRKAGGHALLLSATLGACARAALLDDDDPPPLAEAIAAPYPALSSERHRSPVQQVWEGRAKAVALDVSHGIAAPDEIARRALEAAECGAKVLVVRNLRREAIEVLDALMQRAPDHPALFRCAGVPTLHHGRFAREDRALLDRAVERALGRERPGGGLVLVGTQTLEQSLDIDADLLITDLAPADVLLQRLGRLHRHDRTDRPAGFETARAMILTPPDMDALLGPRGGHGLGGEMNPYMDLIGVEATRRLIEDHRVWTIPAMNRELVERATHPEALYALTDELVARNPAWRSAEVQISGKHFVMAQQGALALLKTHLSFGDPAVVFPNEEAIGTRLGVRDLAVSLTEPMPGPFGQSVLHFTLPIHWVREAPDAGDGGPVTIRVIHNGFMFEFLGNTFIYNEKGLANKSKNTAFSKSV